MVILISVVFSLTKECTPFHENVHLSQSGGGTKIVAGRKIILPQMKMQWTYLDQYNGALEHRDKNNEESQKIVLFTIQ